LKKKKIEKIKMKLIFFFEDVHIKMNCQKKMELLGRLPIDLQTRILEMHHYDSVMTSKMVLRRILRRSKRFQCDFGPFVHAEMFQHIHEMMRLWDAILMLDKIETETVFICKREHDIIYQCTESVIGEIGDESLLDTFDKLEAVMMRVCGRNKIVN